MSRFIVVVLLTLLFACQREGYYMEPDDMLVAGTFGSSSGNAPAISTFNKTFGIVGTLSVQTVPMAVVSHQDTYFYKENGDNSIYTYRLGDVVKSRVAVFTGTAMCIDEIGNLAFVDRAKGALYSTDGSNAENKRLILLDSTLHMVSQITYVNDRFYYLSTGNGICQIWSIADDGTDKKLELLTDGSLQRFTVDDDNIVYCTKSYGNGYDIRSKSILSGTTRILASNLPFYAFGLVAVSGRVYYSQLGKIYEYNKSYGAPVLYFELNSPVLVLQKKPR